MRKIHTISQNLNAIKIIPSEIWLLWSFPFTNFKNFQNHAVQVKRKNFHCTEKGVLTSFMVKTAFNSAFKAFVLYLQTNKWLHICNLQIALLGLFASCLYFCVSRSESENILEAYERFRCPTMNMSWSCLGVNMPKVKL